MKRPYRREAAAAILGRVMGEARKQLLVGAVFLGAAVLVVVACSVFVARRVTEHTEVRNLSDRTVTNVVLEVRDYQSSWSITNRVARLQPGESLRVYHSHRDSRAVVGFTIGGRSFRYEEAYIDLWTGEGWHFDIQRDGTVTSGYDNVNGRVLRRPEPSL